MRWTLLPPSFLLGQTTGKPLSPAFPVLIPLLSPPTPCSLQIKRPLTSDGLSCAGHLQGHSLMLAQGQVERKDMYELGGAQ